MKYDKESLIKHNASYHYEHTVTDYDVQKANDHIGLIGSTRSITAPKAGDRVRYTTKHGDYYHCAHIDYNKGGVCNICEKPYVPFIYADGKSGIICSTSGGAWANISTNQLRYVGKEKKFFTDWGHCGARGNGAIQFEAEVSVWEYIHPEPLYGDFTTEKWRKFYVSKIAEERRNEHNGYLYTATAALACGGMQTAFRTEEEYQAFLLDFKAAIFDGNWQNSFVVWCYKEDRIRTTSEKYDALDLPVITIYENGQRPAKIQYDDDNKTAILYFVM